MAAIPLELVLPTLSVRRMGTLVVFVNRPGLDIADDDWQAYVRWLRDLQRETPELGILTAAGGRAPTTAQRSLLSRELKTEHIRVAVLLSDPKLLIIVKVTSWLLKGTQAFKAHQVEEALAFLGQGDGARVRMTIRELGGVVYTPAAAG